MVQLFNARIKCRASGFYHNLFLKLERRVIASPSLLYSRCSFLMMVKLANDGLLQADDGKMLVNYGKMLVSYGEMLVNDGEMSI